MMSASHPGDEPTVDSSQGARREQVAARFRSAWHRARETGVQPDIETFLGDIADPERATIRDDLVRIETEFREHLADSRPGAGGENHPGPDSPTPSADPPGVPETVEPFAPAARSPGETVDSNVRAARAGEVRASQTDATARAATPAIPGYEILGELGRGGMAIVYRARQAKLNRLVAIKMLLAGVHATAEQRARFYTEAQSVALLQHPNIVQIYEIAEHDGLTYFALEYVDGQSLEASLSGKPLSATEAAELIHLLALAMAYAHEHGVIHRDLKPGNVLLTTEGLPKIADFGLAKQIEGDDSQTKTGTIMGTVSYMAPEQARGEIRAIGPSADIYALGAILYELLTGRPPFLAPTPMETLSHVLNREPVPPSRLQANLPRDLEIICLKCLQKEIAKRYETTADLAEDLRRFRSGEPIRARPVSRPERIWRWCRRNPRVATLSAIATSLSIIVIVSLVVIAMRNLRERQAIAAERESTIQRIDLAASVVSTGDHRRAEDLLRARSITLEQHRDLADLRSRLDKLSSQVSVFAEFKQLLDRAKFYGLFGSRGTLGEAQAACQQLIQLYDDIRSRRGSAQYGLPELSPTQQQLFQEDVFEMFLLAGQVEWDLAAYTDDENKKVEAARQAIAWLDRAEGLLPPTKALYVRRLAYLEALGETEAIHANQQRATQIEPTSVVDHFWHGIADHMRADTARGQGKQQEARQSYESALAEYAALLRIRPDHFWAYFDSANCQTQLSDYREAIIGFTSCLKEKPELPWAYYNRGIAHMQLQEYDQAEEDFQHALDRNPQYVDAYYSLSDLARARGDNELALANLSKVLELDPTYTRAYFLRAQLHSKSNDVEKALRDFSRVIELQPAHGSAYYQRAELFREQQRFDKALEDYARHLELNPRDLQTYFRQGAIHFARKEWELARDRYTSALALDPNPRVQLLAYQSRAMCNILIKDLDAALEDWNQVGALQLTNHLAPYYIGVIKMGQGEYDAARESFKTAIENKPDNAMPYLARAQLDHWQGSLQEALSTLDYVVAKLRPDDAGVLCDRADVYLTMGRVTEAEADYQQAISVEPEKIDAYLGLARVARRLQNAELEQTWYDQMVAANPASPDAYLRRAEFRRDRGEFEQAEHDCDLAAENASEPTLVALARASIAASRGEYREAVENAARTIEDASPADRKDGHVLYAAACVWSLAAKAAEREPMVETDGPMDPDDLRDHARRLLGDALRIGFHDFTYQEHNRMPDDKAIAQFIEQGFRQQLVRDRQTDVGADEDSHPVR